MITPLHQESNPDEDDETPPLSLPELHHQITLTEFIDDTQYKAYTRCLNQVPVRQRRENGLYWDIAFTLSDKHKKWKATQ
jgi:hypothetical protein